MNIDTAPYQIIREIGKGAYGTVYLVKGPEGYAALKLCIKPEDGDDRAYFREQRGIQKYVSLPPVPGVVGIRKLIVVPNGKFFYYVMDLADDECSGRNFNPKTYRPKTLVEILSAEVALSVRDSLALAIRIASTIEALQQNHLAHRDIKPGNVLFVKGEAVLADIGLVTDMREASSIVGTPGYEPPEHHGTPQGDVFSLGRTLFRVCTGRSADEAGFSPCKEAETESPYFWRLLVIANKASSENPSLRYRSAKGMLKDLKSLRRRIFLDRFGRPFLIGLVFVVVATAALIVAHVLRHPPKSKTDEFYERHGIDLEAQFQQNQREAELMYERSLRELKETERQIREEKEKNERLRQEELARQREEKAKEEEKRRLREEKTRKWEEERQEAAEKARQWKLELKRKQEEEERKKKEEELKREEERRRKEEIRRQEAEDFQRRMEELQRWVDEHGEK